MQIFFPWLEKAMRQILILTLKQPKSEEFHRYSPGSSARVVMKKIKCDPAPQHLTHLSIFYQLSSHSCCLSIKLLRTILWLFRIHPLCNETCKPSEQFLVVQHYQLSDLFYGMTFSGNKCSTVCRELLQISTKLIKENVRKKYLRYFASNVPS